MSHRFSPRGFCFVSVALLLLIISFDALWHPGTLSGLGVLVLAAAAALAVMAGTSWGRIRRAWLLHRLHQELTKSNVHLYL